MVYYKHPDSAKISCAQWVASDDKADLAVLHMKRRCENYIPMCHNNATDISAECYGFPDNSSICVKSSVRVEHYYDHENHFQISNANAVTLGFSGGPVLYNGVAIGIIESITNKDQYGRMSEVAIAISAQPALKTLSQYIVAKEFCTGYGVKEKNCFNYVTTSDVCAKSQGLCETCYTQKYIDEIKALYKAQNYHIHEENGFFIAELHYGASRYYDAIFIIIKFGETLKKEDIYPIPIKLSSCRFKISQTIIVTNADLDSGCHEIMTANNCILERKEGLYQKLFNFEVYRSDLRSHVNSEQLSNHFIDVYGTHVFSGGRNIDISHNETEEVLDENGLFIDDYYFDDDETYERHNQRNKLHGQLLKDYVSAFLESKHQALLILGDYGSGKTSFCYKYALDLLTLFIEQKSPYLPILIKLRSYNKAVGIAQILTDYFVNELGINIFNIGTLKLLLKNIHVVLIFDGYDEVAKKVDFDIKYDVLRDICDYAEKTTKIIITCRPNYFQNGTEFKEIFQGSHFQYEPGDKPLLEFIENTIAELDEKQIDAYLSSYHRELADRNISKKMLLQSITSTHDLSDLVKRPFLLYMIIKTLPQILSETKEKKVSKINASKLYKDYTNNWLIREERKNKTLIKREDKELFCKELAYKLYITNSTSLSYKEFPETIKLYFKNVEQKEDIDYFSHDIQSCSFLTSDRSGEFTFIHKSFMEYFVADRVVKKLKASIFADNAVAEKANMVNNILGNVELSMEICAFIRDILQEIERTIIDEITEIADWLNSTASANILSIISKTDLNMSNYLLKYTVLQHITHHLDFSYAYFDGGVIECLSFQDAHFYSAKINNTVFKNCNFQGAVFEKAVLENVKFCDCHFISSKWRKTKLVKCEFGTSLLFDDSCLDLYTEAYFENISLEIEQCNFKNSLWNNSTMKSCSFNNCIFEDNIMDWVVIHNCSFVDVDFSGIQFIGDCKNNSTYDVLGAPYDL